MRTIATRYLPLLIAFLCPMASSAQTWRAYTDLSFHGGSYRELGEGLLFVPLLYDEDTLLFADLRGKVFDDSSSEGNWGIGLRQILDSGWIAGLYGFYDLRETQFNNHFNQITIGAELLNEEWGFRINGYIPESGSETIATGLPEGVFLQGSSIMMRSAGTDSVERALYGLDAESPGAWEPVSWCRSRQYGERQFGRPR